MPMFDEPPAFKGSVKFDLTLSLCAGSPVAIKLLWTGGFRHGSTARRSTP